MLTPPPARRPAGFTLIELLVVIAIIAILTAIIFPVFATVRENARQQSSIAAMHQIQTGLAQFKLDQGVYPPVLFGYAMPGARMDNALQMAEQSAQKDAAAQYFPGLYPEYIKNPLTFTDGNNPVSDLSKTTATPLPVNSVVPATNGQSATLATATTYPYTDATHVDSNAVATNFYLADAFDISPQITGTNQLSKTVYVVRYSTHWTDIYAPGANDPYDSAPGATPVFLNYNRQLGWQSPPADTYVTSTTYHVPNDNHVLVLWESGDAKTIDASRFLAGAAGNNANADTTTAPAGTTPADTAKFWQVSPTTPSNPGP